MTEPELQENTCAEKPSTHRIPPELLRLWLNDRRNRLDKERLRLLTVADGIKKEIAAYDQLLAELTT